MADCVRENSPEDRRNAIASEPDTASKSMLGGCVPHADHDGEARADGTFKYAK